MFGILVALTICALFKGKPKTISFNRLPILVRIEVIKSLDYRDCWNLAMASKRAAETVRVSRIKPSFAAIEISPSACIKLGRGNAKSPDLEENKVSIADVMKWIEMNKRTDYQSDSILEDTAAIYNGIRHLFQVDIPFLLSFATGYNTVTTVKEVLSNPTLQNWKFCYFKGKKMSSEELKMILDMASSDKCFASAAEEGPKELRHEKAFHFKDNLYADARWVKIEDLYGMKNCELVTLGKTNFTKSDIKTFISYWVNSDIDMFWRLIINTTEHFETVDVLDEFPALHIENAITCFIKVKSSGARKRTLLSVTKAHSLFLTAWAPEEFTSRAGEECDRMIRNKHGVIDLLIEKKQLESEEESADGENKRRIWNRLQQLDDEIRDYGVFYVDGRATLKEPTQ